MILRMMKEKCINISKSLAKLKSRVDEVEDENPLKPVKWYEEDVL
jgi:hypothetical protein